MSTRRTVASHNADPDSVPGFVRNITGAEIGHFRQYGFVLLKNILSEAAVAQLGEAMTAAVDGFADSPRGCDLTDFAAAASAAPAPKGHNRHTAAPFCEAPMGPALQAAGAHTLLDRPVAKSPAGHSLLDGAVTRRVSALRTFAYEGDCPRIASGLLDVGQMRFFDDILCVKEAGAVERVAFHQDISYMAVDGESGCVFWTFVDPVREGRGAPGYIPGSHRWGQIFRPNFLLSDLPCPGSEGVPLPGIEASPEAFGVQYVEADPGDLIVHHALTVYGKQGNRGRRPVRGFGLRYVDADLKFRRRPGVVLTTDYRRPPRNGMALDDEVHPIVWPRPVA